MTEPTTAEIRDDLYSKEPLYDPASVAKDLLKRLEIAEATIEELKQQIEVYWSPYFDAWEKSEAKRIEQVQGMNVINERLLDGAKRAEATIKSIGKMVEHNCMGGKACLCCQIQALLKEHDNG